MTQVLVQELDELGVVRTVHHPFVYLVDGHKSHVSFKLFKWCKENHIVLVTFFPNATHILQMADVGIFGPGKRAWTSEVQKWKRETSNRELKLSDFCKILKP